MTEINETTALAQIQQARRVVIKLGSSLVTDGGNGVDQARIAALVMQVHAALDRGVQVILVSSGAVAEGCARLGLQARPTALHDLQAAAAVGQVGLIAAYESAFRARDRHAALVLLTHDDFADRERYLNARTTLMRLLVQGVTPVINENDTVANDEIRVGDNDTLAGLVANLLQAEALLLLTDTEGLRQADPREQPNAPVVRFARADDARLRQMAGPGGAFGRGGMVTKIKTARLAMRSGAHTIIADGRQPGVIDRVLAGESVGTVLAATTTRLHARKRWIAGQLKPRGTLVLDPGAARAVKTERRSLLSVGVTEVLGEFRRGDVVRIVGPDGVPLAQGLVHYSSVETVQLLGASTQEMAERLGYVNEPEIVHRDNMVLADE